MSPQPGAVIAMVSVGAGARARVAEQLRKLGPDLIYAMGRDSVCGRARLAGARMILTRHLHALCSTCRAGYPRRLERPTMSLGVAKPSA